MRRRQGSVFGPFVRCAANRQGFGPDGEPAVPDEFHVEALVYDAEEAHPWMRDVGLIGWIGNRSASLSEVAHVDAARERMD